MSAIEPNYAARRRRKEETRSTILQAAADTFYREGIASVSMEEIAAAAGVSKPTLYKHFSTKELVVSECLSSVDEKHFRWFVDQLGHAESNTELPAVAVFDVLDKWINSRSFHGCTFINASVQVGKTNPDAQLAVFRHKDRTRTWLLELVEDSGIRAGSSRELADHLMLLMEGAIITALVEDDHQAAQRAKRAAVILVEAEKMSVDN
ncbi:AcrR family transcriptional regulator [Rhodococcus sp. 27YEA15]|uniref:TetR/AcrR family transcriptional regulator n=1 Tax=Rhodococcus sp. 27YEA15 TaxID=3156259 RepID=UPI003C7B6454